jgi:hypothetical protein
MSGLDVSSNVFDSRLFITVFLGRHYPLSNVHYLSFSNSPCDFLHCLRHKSHKTSVSTDKALPEEGSRAGSRNVVDSSLFNWVVIL